MIKFVSFILTFSIFVATTPFSLAQTASKFEIKTLVNNGKKSEEVSSMLTFSGTSFRTDNKKTNAVIKELNFTDVKAADYSYAKKPLLSTGGAVAMAIFTGLLVLPFLFVKKKQHWLSIRTENDYVVMRLDKDNYRQILNEFEIHKVAVKTIDEEEEKKKDK